MTDTVGVAAPRKGRPSSPSWRRSRGYRGRQRASTTWRRRSATRRSSRRVTEEATEDYERLASDSDVDTAYRPVFCVTTGRASPDTVSFVYLDDV